MTWDNLAQFILRALPPPDRERLEPELLEVLNATRAAGRAWSRTCGEVRRPLRPPRGRISEHTSCEAMPAIHPVLVGVVEGDGDSVVAVRHRTLPICRPGRPPGYACCDRDDPAN
jgi:hypothetical protein